MAVAVFVTGVLTGGVEFGLQAEHSQESRTNAAAAQEGQANKDVTLETAPPVVVKTIPQAGDPQVDPKLTEIRAVFSKDMRDESWSWVTLGKGNFPTVTGKPRYLADKRTCVLPVALEPGKSYAIWINNEKFANFKDVEGRTAVPYLLVFKTKE